MSCPCLLEEYVGFCGGSDFPYVPSITEMEKWCFRDTYASCPVFESIKPPDLSAKCEDAKAGSRLLISSGCCREARSPVSAHADKRKAP